MAGSLGRWRRELSRRAAARQRTRAAASGGASAAQPISPDVEAPAAAPAPPTSASEASPVRAATRAPSTSDRRVQPGAVERRRRAPAPAPRPRARSAGSRKVASSTTARPAARQARRVVDHGVVDAGACLRARRPRGGSRSQGPRLHSRLRISSVRRITAPGRAPRAGAMARAKPRLARAGQPAHRGQHRRRRRQVGGGGLDIGPARVSASPWWAVTWARTAARTACNSGRAARPSQSSGREAARRLVQLAVQRPVTAGVAAAAEVQVHEQEGQVVVDVDVG